MCNRLQIWVNEFHMFKVNNENNILMLLFLMRTLSTFNATFSTLFQQRRIQKPVEHLFLQKSPPQMLSWVLNSSLSSPVFLAPLSTMNIYLCTGVLGTIIQTHPVLLFSKSRLLTTFFRLSKLYRLVRLKSKFTSM